MYSLRTARLERPVNLAVAGSIQSQPTRTVGMSVPTATPRTPSRINEDEAEEEIEGGIRGADLEQLPLPAAHHEDALGAAIGEHGRRKWRGEAPARPRTSSDSTCLRPLRILMTGSR